MGEKGEHRKKDGKKTNLKDVFLAKLKSTRIIVKHPAQHKMTVAIG